MANLYGVVDGVRVEPDRVVWLGDGVIPEVVVVNGKNFIPAIVVEKDCVFSRHKFLFVSEDERLYLVFSLRDYSVNVDVLDNTGYEVLFKGLEKVGKYRELVKAFDECNHMAAKLTYERVGKLKNDLEVVREFGDWVLKVYLRDIFKTWKPEVIVFYRNREVYLEDYVKWDRIYVKKFMDEYGVTDKTKAAVREELKMVYRQAKELERDAKERIQDVYDAALREVAAKFDNVFVEQ